MQVGPSELVRCNPDRGRVAQGGTLDMELTLSCMEPQSVNTQVLVPHSCTACCLSMLLLVCFVFFTKDCSSVIWARCSLQQAPNSQFD